MGTHGIAKAWSLREAGDPRDKLKTPANGASRWMAPRIAGRPEERSSAGRAPRPADMVPTEPQGFPDNEATWIDGMGPGRHRQQTSRSAVQSGPYPPGSAIPRRTTSPRRPDRLSPAREPPAGGALAVIVDPEFQRRLTHPPGPPLVSQQDPVIPRQALRGMCVVGSFGLQRSCRDVQKR